MEDLDKMANSGTRLRYAIATEGLGGEGGKAEPHKGPAERKEKREPKMEPMDADDAGKPY